MVMALVGLSIYRFVVVDMESIKLDTDDSMQKAAVQALVAVIQQEFMSLPQKEEAALQGDAHKFNGKESDQVKWLTQAGNGLFTEMAEGLWQSSLVLRPDDKGGSNTLGLLRNLFVKGKTGADGHWLPLLGNVDALEVRYYDGQQNTWTDKWADKVNRPTLVRIRIWRANQDVPYEAIIPLPPTQIPA